jgi:hypothetical protein
MQVYEHLLEKGGGGKDTGMEKEAVFQDNPCWHAVRKAIDSWSYIK